MPGPGGPGGGGRGGWGHSHPRPRGRGCRGCLTPVIAIAAFAVAGLAMLPF